MGTTVIHYRHNDVTYSREFCALFNRNEHKFLCLFMTVYERILHHNTPETMQKLTQWVSPGKLAMEIAKVGITVKKVIATVVGILVLFSTSIFLNQLV